MKYKKLILLSLCMLFGGIHIVSLPDGSVTKTNARTLELSNGRTAVVVDGMIRLQRIEQIKQTKALFLDPKTMRELGEFSLYNNTFMAKDAFEDPLSKEITGTLPEMLFALPREAKGALVLVRLTPETFENLSIDETGIAEPILLPEPEMHEGRLLYPTKCIFLGLKDDKIAQLVPNRNANGEINFKRVVLDGQD
jgi:hypothetical protein